MLVTRDKRYYKLLNEQTNVNNTILKEKNKEESNGMYLGSVRVSCARDTLPGD